MERPEDQGNGTDHRRPGVQSTTNTRSYEHQRSLQGSVRTGPRDRCRGPTAVGAEVGREGFLTGEVVTGVRDPTPVGDVNALRRERVPGPG